MLQFVCLQPAKAILTVFKPVGFEAQVEPSYSSVAPTVTVVLPPKATAAVCVPST
jgi:hypothetical protein